jgi:CheY-like chemotaxis protein
MYVDDEPDIRAIAELALQVLGGFQVTLCSSGREALKRAAETPPDLILLDVMMPDMDGPATLRAMGQVPVLADVPVVFVTAKAQPAEVARLRELGAVNVIAKPFDPMTLPDQVREAWQQLDPEAAGAPPGS